MKLVLRTIVMFGLAGLLLGCPKSKEDKDLSEIPSRAWIWTDCACSGSRNTYCVLQRLLMTEWV